MLKKDAFVAMLQIEKINTHTHTKPVNGVLYNYYYYL